MLTTAFLHIPQLQFSPFSPISKPIKSPTSFDKKKSSNANKILQHPCFPCRISSLSSQEQNSRKIICFSEYPDGEFSAASKYSPVSRLLDANTLASLLQSCSRLKEVRGIHAVIIKRLENYLMFINNNLISLYVRFGELTDARRVFDEMPERNVVSWTAMLNGCLKLGLDDEFMDLFSELINNQIQLHASTFVIVLNMCSKRLDLELGEQIHSCILKGRCSNLIINSALVCFYAKCGDLLAARTVFDKMPERDVVCWTAMITAYAQNGHGEEAFSLFSRMQYDGFRPNEFTVCSTLKACGEENALKFGRQLHGAVVKKVIIDDVFVGSSLVSMYVKCGQVLDARMVFDGMIRRNTVTWTSMIAGYAQNGHGEEAIRLYRKMKRRRILANNLTIVSVLSACGLVGSLCMGKEVHAQILKNSIEKNMYIGSTLVWFYCKCGEYGYATNVLETMPLRDVVSWTAIVSGYACFGHGLDALEFLHDMLWEGVEPNPFTYSSALKACAKQGAMRQGKWIHASVNKAPALSNVYVGSALIDMYLKCGCVDDAFRVFDMMPDRNLVSWKVMIIGYARNGHCQEALQLMYRMQAEGIKVDDFIRTTVLNACGGVEWGTEFSVHTLQSR